ncbi:MAG: hypothetical protein BMS9Abin03_051 [Thermodesulfobacteriota bacterium]|nr:MAG: hypothetical protein BMS9Abin03_051 [Thermodesulfobacteriota bacterium]
MAAQFAISYVNKILFFLESAQPVPVWYMDEIIICIAVKKLIAQWNMAIRCNI